MSENLTGGCRCGAIRYECPDAVIFAGHCHCRDCQYASGGAYSTVVGVASESVTIEGETSAFTVDAASGNTAAFLRELWVAAFLRIICQSRDAHFESWKPR